jgi:pimeloyl-ACP methyl ester carboxylesterase
MRWPKLSSVVSIFCGALACVSLATCAGGARAAPAARLASSAARPQLVLAPCQLPGLERPARCGTLEVFENRQTRRGRRIGIRVAVLPATAPVPAPDALFIIVGGPGQSAVATAKAFSGIFAGVLAERDIVLVDQRGTGGSHPLDCPLPGSDDDPQSYFGEMLPVAALRDCLTRLDADPALYTTPIAMDDLDDVRAALGYPRIDLYGSSYGSRAALVYMRSHPERVRSTVLRGAVPTDMKLPLYYARDSQRALELLFDECAADAACRQAFPDLRARHAAVQERLARGPVSVDVTQQDTGERVFHIRLGLDEYNEALRYRLYNEESNQIPLYVTRAADGDFSGMGKLALRLRRVAAKGQWLSVGLFLSITCAEDVPFIDPEEARRLAAGTFLGTYRVDQQVRACQVWPRGALPPGFTDPVRSPAPALIISGQRDPVAPPVWGEEIARQLPNSKHLVLAQGFHGLPDPCITRIMNDFIRGGTAAGLDTACTAAAEKVPFVLPAPAAAPAAAALAPSPEGLWKGTLVYKRAELEADILVDLARDAKGKWVGTIDVPNQRMKFYPLDNVRVDGSAVYFEFNRFAQRAQVMVETPITGTLAADGSTLTADYFEGKKNHLPVTFKRIGDAGGERPEPRLAEVHALSDSGEELRTLFNRDAGKTRLILLLSPT